MEQNNSSQIKNYLILFLLIYTSLTTALILISYIFDFDPGSGGNIGITIGASFYTSFKFVNEHKRAPNKYEKNYLVWGCLAILIIVSLLAAGLYISIVAGPEGFQELLDLYNELPGSIWIGIYFGVTLFLYVLLNLSFGWQARKIAAKLNKLAN